jgi:hypothetical protein
MASKHYLCRKVQDGEITKADVLEIQSRITLLNQAPKIINDAVAKGWISYPANDYIEKEEDLSEWLKKYDCELAYQRRQEGMTYRAIAKLMKVGIARITHILHRGEEIVLQRKLKDLDIKPIDLPSKATVRKHTTVTKRTKRAKS